MLGRHARYLTQAGAFVSFVCLFSGLFPSYVLSPPQTKQVQIMGLMVVVLDVEAVDVFRRLLCSMY